VLVTASEILRTLSPSRLATLLIVDEGETQSQSKVADIIGRNQSTVSDYFRSLKSPIPLAEKRGKHYTVTDTGRAVIDVIDTAITELGLDLQSVDWKSKNDRQEVGELLSPLHDSRSVVPFFILYSLYERSEVDDRQDTPQPVWIDDIIFDVDRRLHEVDVSGEVGDEETNRTDITKQVRPMIDRFEEADTITYDGSQLTLIEKGHQQAWLLAELVQFLAKEKETGESESETETAEGELDDFSIGRTDPDGQQRDTSLNDLATQIKTQKSRNDEPSFDVDHLDIGGKAAVTTGFCLQSVHESDRGRRQSEPQSVLPLKEMSLDALKDRVDHLAREYEENMKLVPYWLLQTDSGIYPLAPTDSSTSESLETQVGSPRR
jgi:DNA-binding MarR family transcriptional regulator